VKGVTRRRSNGGMVAEDWAEMISGVWRRD
jgi:hypothetical protein